MNMIIVILALMQACWMLFDGIHVLHKGKYFGPPTPGPWRHMFIKLGVNPLALGPLFITLGLCWFIAAYALIFNFTWASELVLLCAIASLWYLPIGSIIALIILILIFLS